MKNPTGIATLLIAGEPIVSIMLASDGSFLWRSRGKLALKAKDGKEHLASRTHHGFADCQTAVAAAITYLRRCWTKEVADGAVTLGAFVAPARAGFAPKRLVDSEDFKAALGLAAKIKMPADVKKALAAAAAAAAEAAEAAEAAQAAEAAAEAPEAAAKPAKPAKAAKLKSA